MDLLVISQKIVFYKLNCSFKSMMKAKYEGVISIIFDVWYLKYIHVHHNMHPCGLNSKIKVQSVYDVTWVVSLIKHQIFCFRIKSLLSSFNYQS